MVVCPKCKSEISFIRLIYSKNIRCKSCSSDLIAKQKKYSIIIVLILIAINGGTVSFIIQNMFNKGELIYLLLFIGLSILVIFEMWVISITLIKLEVSEPHQDNQSPIPPPFNIS